MEEKIKVAFQGEKGAYSHLACLEIFPNEKSGVHCLGSFPNEQSTVWKVIHKHLENVPHIPHLYLIFQFQILCSFLWKLFASQAVSF